MQESQHPTESFLSGDKAVDVESDEEVMKYMLEYARQAITDQTRNSRIFDFEKDAAVPTFDFSELSVGPLLGRGGFCDVSEIVSISLKSTGEVSEEKKESATHVRNEYTDRHTREFIASHVLRADQKSGREEARYAIKQLSVGTRNDTKKCVQGTVDIALEARFLAVLEHPNIIKMRGMVGGDIFMANRCFLILDRLYDTLSDRLAKWATRSKQISKTFSFMGKKKKEKTKDLLIERITVSYDLAFALTYMHSLDMLYRDLKPENIGFDVRGDVKIFDFGLAKELHPSLMVSDDLYELTASTGSPRYMAPEVCIGDPYNRKADVYSFTVLFWQILSLEVPYDNYDYSFFYNNVMCGKDRPKISKSWPSRWTDLLECGWSRNLFERPSMAEYLSILEEEMVELQGCGDSRALSRSEVSNS